MQSYTPNDSFFKKGLRIAGVTLIIGVLLFQTVIPVFAANTNPTPIPTPNPDQLGPDQFPAGINPLTGEPVADPSLLQYPPALVSISNFPASARPQAGLSYASIVYEMWIGEGMSRFLTVFYGGFPPSPEDHASISGMLWSDNDRNGLHGNSEPGVPGVTVKIKNEFGGAFDTVITDASGKFSFNNLPAGTFTIQVEPPTGASFSPSNVGTDSSVNSKCDPKTGSFHLIANKNQALTAQQCGLLLSLPMISSLVPTSTPTPVGGEQGNSNATVDLPTTGDPGIGPIRSGRLPYEYIRTFYRGFLVMAGAWSGVSAKLNDFTNYFGSDEGDNSSVIPVSSLETIAKNNEKVLGGGQLTGNLFDPIPPAGGSKGTSLYVDFNIFNQFFWRYDPATGGYHRWQNDTVTGEKFTELKDRLTSQPLDYQNVIVLFADHNAMAETLVDIPLLYSSGPAKLFRDGQVYDIRWTTISGDYEQTTGLLRPIRYMDEKGNPIPLKPGQTWVVIANTFSKFFETVDSMDYFQLNNTKSPGSGLWSLRFNVPVVQKKK